MIAQSLVSAWLLTFTISLDDVVISAFLSGPGSTTMPLVIFSRARLGLNPSVNAVATIIVVVVAIGVVLASWLIARAERQRALEMAAADARPDTRTPITTPARRAPMTTDPPHPARAGPGRRIPGRWRRPATTRC